MTALLDLAVRRITAEPNVSTYVKPGDIKFPAGLTPKIIATPSTISGALPQADAIVTAYTAAEKQALADVLSPGAEFSRWGKYTHNLPTYEPHLTDRSPAREEGCLAYVQYVMIGNLTVCLAGVNLHWSTDDATIPVMALAQQMSTETGVSDLIDHGTAGGRAPERLGDVIVAQNIKLDAANSQWSNEPWAQQLFPATQLTETQMQYALEGLDLVPSWVLAKLKASGYSDGKTPSLVTGKDILTVPTFAYADDDDSFGLAKNDPNFGCEEMDVGVIALALSRMTNPPNLIAVRNASDPQMKDGSAASKKLAEDIYEKNGYATTVCSALVAWGALAGLATSTQ